MSLLNVEDSVPAETWAVVRLLLSAGGKIELDRARALLAPASLHAPDSKKNSVDWAVGCLRGLGLAETEGDQLSLTAQAAGLRADDIFGFTELLRRSVLKPDNNEGLANDDDSKGAKDLTRALAWFLTRDTEMPLAKDGITKLQDGLLPEGVKNPLPNDTRWTQFSYWAPGLGFAAAPLLGVGNAARLMTDCTVAVRQTIRFLWTNGEKVEAPDLVGKILDELPVLPGGSYSRALGLAASETEVSASLSFALLRGHYEKWIELRSQSDSPHKIFLTDPSTPDARLQVTEVIIKGIPQ
jgi:hypothetical protein